MNPQILTFDAPEIGKPVRLNIGTHCLLKTVRFQDGALLALSINGKAHVTTTQGAGLRSPFAPGFTLQPGDVVELAFDAKTRGHLTLQPADAPKTAAPLRAPK